MRRTVAVAIAVACVLAGACSSGDDTGGDAAAEGAPEAGEAAVTSDSDLHATLQRSTLFETRRSLLLTVVHDGDSDLQVGTIQLDTPLFEPVAPEERDARLRAGGRVGMPLPFGEPRCDDEADEPAVLVAEIDGDEVRVAIEERPSNLLAALHDAECAAAAVLADVELRLGDAWEPTEPRTVAGRLEVAQREDGVTATVEEVLGNVIFTVRTDETDPVIDVSDDRRSADVGVAITASRCDPHALIEYKRTFIFTASVRVGDDEPVEVDVQAEGDARRVLEDLLTTCIG
ncbi:MAG TPA: hypothetical protein VFZ79_00850 [Acidimicrobiales bacterium]